MRRSQRTRSSIERARIVTAYDALVHILVLTDRDWTHPQGGGTGTNLYGHASLWLVSLERAQQSDDAFLRQLVTADGGRPPIGVRNAGDHRLETLDQLLALAWTTGLCPPHKRQLRCGIATRAPAVRSRPSGIGGVLR